MHKCKETYWGSGLCSLLKTGDVSKIQRALTTQNAETVAYLLYLWLGQSSVPLHLLSAYALNVTEKAHESENPCSLDLGIYLLCSTEKKPVYCMQLRSRCGTN